MLNLETVRNESEHFGGMGRPSENIMRLRPNAVITHGMGSRALSMFQNANMAVLQTNKDFVKDIIEAHNRGELVKLREAATRQAQIKKAVLKKFNVLP